MTTDDKVRDKKLQYDINKEAAKITFYLFNYDLSKSTFVMLNMAFSLHSLEY